MRLMSPLLDDSFWDFHKYHRLTINNITDCLYDMLDFYSFDYWDLSFQ